ncbi:lachesin-like [Ctenocephalides felis]|uniref:lachesin-like n=1 Tax=Ctenocephalides felis TaxID=7515 RepID=UPI000E6E406F|nr:lachesin-like [Ctenocephalides felis]
MSPWLATVAEPPPILNGNELEASFETMSDIPPMYFGTENSTMVTSQIGSTALVPCAVHHIGEGMVSWIRRKDYHLLTVGLTTYSSDERFSAIHLQHSEDWTLQIKFVQARDAGIYECQVSTHPPTSIFIHLNVVEARAEISGPTEKYLKLGSTLRLACSVVQSTEPPIYVFWYHNNRMINYDGDRGVNVTTELALKHSALVVTTATPRHTGNYSCVPNNALPASTYVHILNVQIISTNSEHNSLFSIVERLYDVALIRDSNEILQYREFTYR